MPKSTIHSKWSSTDPSTTPSAPVSKKHDHYKQISKHKYNKTKGKLTEFLIIMSISIQTQRLTPLKYFIQLHSPSQYKTLTHYKLDSTFGRLMY